MRPGLRPGLQPMIARAIAPTAMTMPSVVIDSARRATSPITASGCPLRPKASTSSSGMPVIRIAVTRTQKSDRACVPHRSTSRRCVTPRKYKLTARPAAMGMATSTAKLNVSMVTISLDSYFSRNRNHQPKKCGLRGPLDPPGRYAPTQVFLRMAWLILALTPSIFISVSGLNRSISSARVLMVSMK